MSSEEGCLGTAGPQASPQASPQRPAPSQPPRPSGVAQPPASGITEAVALAGLLTRSKVHAMSVQLLLLCSQSMWYNCLSALQSQIDAQCCTQETLTGAGTDACCMHVALQLAELLWLYTGTNGLSCCVAWLHIRQLTDGACQASVHLGNTAPHIYLWAITALMLRPSCHPY